MDKSDWDYNFNLQDMKECFFLVSNNEQKERKVESFAPNTLIIWVMDICIFENLISYKGSVWNI